VTRRVRRTAVAALTAVTVGTGLVALAGPAAAKPILHVAYRAKGTSTIAKTNSSVLLGPTTLTSAVTKTGSLTGTMPLPPTSTTFSALGLLPVSATVTFAEVGKIKGKLFANPKPAVSADSAYAIGLSNVTVAGIPTPVGSNCATTQPVQIDVASPTGKPFDLTKGGVLTGTYTIGDFANCGLTTTLINLLVPGPGNTVSLTLSHGHIVST
jgi:hypothetical protein